MTGRTIIVHASDTARLEDMQALVDTDDERPMGMQGLVKALSPAYVVMAFYYTAEDLEPESAAAAFSQALSASDTTRRLELSDLIQAVQSAGADWVINGRLFVSRLNHLRQWEAFSTRGALNALRTGRFILQAVTAVRLDADKVQESLDQGMEFDELLPANWLSSHTLRSGVFDAD